MSKAMEDVLRNILTGEGVPEKIVNKCLPMLLTYGKTLRRQPFEVTTNNNGRWIVRIYMRH